MAIIPKIKTYDQYLGEALATFQSKIGVTDLNAGSAIVSFFESNAQMVYRATGDTIQILKDYSIDRATGESLRRLAVEEGIKLRPPKAATTTITVKDSSFNKVATKIYAGTKAPNVGSNFLNVGSVDGFPASGQIYVGRNTPNVEGPITYSSITPVGSYFRLNLTSPTVKFHNISETVILAQGGVRTVSPNTVVQTSSMGGATPVKFLTTETSLLLDGENVIENIPVVAQVPSAEGNVARNAIKEFLVVPFAGATVLNPNPVTNGREDEDDETLRTRIKMARASKGLGTALAIKNATSNLTSTEETATVMSNEIITTGGKTTLYLDDGNGYERKTQGIGVEYIVDSALGGETSFQLTTGGKKTGVSKAFIISGNQQPFDISTNDRLSVLVGGVLSEHTFNLNDFKSDGAATAYEVAASINSNYNLLFKATTSAGGTKVSIDAKTEEDEYVQVSTPTSGTDAGVALNFPNEEIETLKLYKNDTPLSSNGRSAFVVSNQQTSWGTTLTSGETLIISVDGTPEQTFVFTDQDFADNTEHSILNASNSLESWCQVINAKIAGVTATVDGQSFRITSNKGKLTSASIVINPASTLITDGNMFGSTLSASGLTKDYTFSRNTAQIKLNTPLQPKDKLTAGSQDTFAKLKSGEILGATLTVPAEGSFWAIVDEPEAALVGTTLFNNQQIDIYPDGDGIAFETTTQAFSKLAVGDYLIVWSNEVNAANRVEGKLSSVTPTKIVMSLTPAEAASVVTESAFYQSGIVVVRSKTPPQRVEIAAATYNIDELADIINLSLVGAYFSTENDSRFVVRSNTVNPDVASLLIVTNTPEVQSLSLPVGVSYSGKTSQVATYETPNDFDFIPLFAHSELSDASANPPDSYVNTLNTSIQFSSLEIDPNALVSFINGYTGQSQATGNVSQIDNYTGTTVTIENNEFIKRVLASDRAYVSSGFQFGHNDSLVVVLDNNPIEKTFIVPLYREITTNSTLTNNPSSFNAYDTETDVTASIATSFGSSFSFDNFKLMMRAKGLLDEAGSENAILYRSSVWGKSGEYVKVSYEYPTQSNQTISHNISVNKDTTIKLILQSGNPVVTNQDGTTEWDVSITPNTPIAGVDQVTYTWNGIGMPPNLTISGGEYVKILTTGEFSAANTGTFRVSTQSGFLPTTDAFTVQRKTGEAVTETGIANLVPTTVSFYEYQDTTALDMVDYVNNNVFNYLTAELVDDSGLSGQGLITLSTYESTNFSSLSIQLKDGVNWIQSTNLSGSPQFTLKQNLQYSSDGGYQFNNKEVVRLVPTTADQVSRLINTLAVTGLSTLSTVNTSQKNKRLQIATNTLGSNGSVQVVGGTGNQVDINVINTSVTTSDTYGKTFISASQANSISSGQLVKVTATDLQEKVTDLSSVNTIEIVPNSPVAGQSRIILGNRQMNQRFFNKLRTHTDIGSNTWKVEKQGKFTCLSYTGVGANPNLGGVPVDFNFTSGDTVSYNKIVSTNFVDITVAGTSTFQDLDIGERVTISGQGTFDGTFDVLGKTNDNKTIRVINSLATTQGPTLTTLTTFTATKSVEEGDTLILSAPFDELNRGTFRVVRRYENSVYYESTNFFEETISLSALETDAIIFSDYDTPVKGDGFVIRGTVFGTRVGTYTIESVISNNEIAVNGIITALPTMVLGADSDNVFVQEATPYVGYKTVRMVTFEPTNEELLNVIWTNNKQIDKINELANTTISATTKLDYPSQNKTGLDAYRYDVGLLAEANRVVYGDPRDTSTYPGVAAAGVEIFIDPPLVRRVSVGVVVRLNTGVPLIQVVEQVRNSVAALINANPIGQSIAISRIVSAVDKISGVRAMAITSPLYDQTNDLILIQPDEKSLVTNPTVDIAVSQIG